MPDLKPCPFCGSPAHVARNARRKICPPQKGIDAGECVGVCAYCENCNAQIFTTVTHLIEEMWNRRANEEAQEITEYISKKEAVSRISDLLIDQLKYKRLPTWNEVYHAIND